MRLCATATRVLDEHVDDHDLPESPSATGSSISSSSASAMV
jgi:hypothetical protein